MMRSAKSFTNPEHEDHLMKPEQKVIRLLSIDCTIAELLSREAASWVAYQHVWHPKKSPNCPFEKYCQT